MSLINVLLIRIISFYNSKIRKIFHGRSSVLFGRKTCINASSHKILTETYEIFFYSAFNISLEVKFLISYEYTHERLCTQYYFFAIFKHFISFKNIYIYKSRLWWITLRCNVKCSVLTQYILCDLEGETGVWDFLLQKHLNPAFHTFNTYKE